MGVLVLCGWVSSAAAADGSSVGVRPADPARSWVTLTLRPGASQRTEAILVNLTDAPQHVRVGAADAITTADGAFTLAGDAEPRRGVGAWIVPDQTELDLGPREERRLGFSVDVPAGAEPGDHAGGLLVRADPVTASPGPEGVAVAITERVGLRVYVDVPGRRDGRVTIEGAGALPVPAAGPRRMLGLADAVEVTFSVRHRGNIQYLRLHAVVELVEGSRVVVATPVDLGTLLPGGARPVRLRLPVPRWRTGGYGVRIVVGGLPSVSAETHVAVGAGRLYASGGLLLGVVVLVSAGIGRRIRRAS